MRMLYQWGLGPHFLFEVQEVMVEYIRKFGGRRERGGLWGYRFTPQKYERARLAFEEGRLPRGR